MSDNETRTLLLILVRSRAVLTWGVLIAATVMSFAVGVEHSTDSLIGVIVLGVAAIKMRLVGLDFMELRHAPKALRLAFEGYCLGLWAVLASSHLWL